jgi:hypothetical protein
MFIPGYIQYGDLLTHLPVDGSRWAELANEQRLLDEINLSIHALVNASDLEYGQQLSSSGDHPIV